MPHPPTPPPPADDAQAAQSEPERLRAIQDRAAEYEYFILDGAAVAPEGRLEELDRLLAADALVLLADLARAAARAEAAEGRVEMLQEAVHVLTNAEAKLEAAKEAWRAKSAALPPENKRLRGQAMDRQERERNWYCRAESAAWQSALGEIREAKEAIVASARAVLAGEEGR